MHRCSYPPLKRLPPDPILCQFLSSLTADFMLPGSTSSGPARLPSDGPWVFAHPSLLRPMLFLQGCLLTCAADDHTIRIFSHRSCHSSLMYSSSLMMELWSWRCCSNFSPTLCSHIIAVRQPLNKRLCLL